MDQDNESTYVGGSAQRMHGILGCGYTYRVTYSFSLDRCRSFPPGLVRLLQDHKDHKRV
jgi:hypothetical protein